MERRTIDAVNTATRALAGESRTRAHAGNVVMELVKPGLSSLVVFTAIAGFAAADGFRSSPGALVPLAIGTALSAAGANAFNQALEFRYDALMIRTRNRPVANRTIGAKRAFAVAFSMLATGIAALATLVNITTAVLALATALIYVLVYTPLKRVTQYSLLAGAVTGAIPPMMGVAAATSHLPFTAWALFALLFVWQIPHFIALAFIHRDDYERAGFRTLVNTGSPDALPALVALTHAFALIPLSLALSLAIPYPGAFDAVAIAAGVAHLATACLFLADRSHKNARLLFFAGVAYLAVLLAALILFSL